jgi:hypothetical protein
LEFEGEASGIVGTFGLCLDRQFPRPAAFRRDHPELDIPELR